MSIKDHILGYTTGPIPQQFLILMWKRQYSAMDWIKFGWGNKYSSEFNPTVNFNVSFENLVKTSLPIQDVANRVISEIIKKYPAPYTLMVSGGVDSQAMLWLWANSGLPFTAVSIKYMSPNNIIWFNEHDLFELGLFSKKHNIAIEYKNFNVIDFFESRLQEYVNKYQCNSPQICTHMAMSELVSDGTVIFSGNFRSDTPYTYTVWGLKRYADIIHKPVIPYFLLHDRELAGCTDRIEPALGLSGNDRGDAFYLNKIKSLHNVGIPVIPQPQKLNGFEKIKEYYDQFPERITVYDKIKYARNPSKRVFDILFRYRMGDKIPYTDAVIYRN